MNFRCRQGRRDGWWDEVLSWWFLLSLSEAESLGIFVSSLDVSISFDLGGPVADMEKRSRVTKDHRCKGI